MTGRAGVYASKRTDRWTIAAGLLLAGAAVLMVLTAGRYGVTWDEYNHITYGQEVFRWFASGFQDRSALDHRLYNMLGGLFDLAGETISRITRSDVVRVRHLLGVTVALVGVLYTFRIGSALGGPPAGFLAMLALLLTPVYYGHAFNNPKDIPLAAGFAASLYYIVAAVPRFPRLSWTDVLKMGLAIGLAAAVRAVALTLLFYLLVAFALFLVLDRLRAAAGVREHLRAAASACAAFAPRFLAIVALAWIVMLAFWPAAQVSPFAHVVRVLGETHSFPWNLPVRFEGELIRATALPRYYVAKWIVISLPELHFIAGAVCVGAIAYALVRLLRGATTPDERWVGAAVLGLAIVFPVGYQAVRHAVVYDAWRHFLMIVPPIAALAGWSLSWLLSMRGRGLAFVKWPVLAAAAVSGAITIADMVRLHPYQTVYFNRLVAGDGAHAAELYETDYWGASYGEGIEWLERNYATDAAPGSVRVASCSHPFLVDYYLDAPRFEHIGYPDPDAATHVLVATTRFDCHLRLPGRVLHVVQRRGIPLLYIREVRPVS